MTDFSMDYGNESVRHFIELDEENLPIIVWREDWHGANEYQTQLYPNTVIEIPPKDVKAFVFEYRKWAWIDGKRVLYVKPQEKIEKEVEEALIKQVTELVQTKLDEGAQQRNYDNILSLCSYATSTDPIFSVEGQAGVNWRDSCWRYCYQVLSNVKSGLRPTPTVEELISELPQISWPA